MAEYEPVDSADETLVLPYHDLDPPDLEAIFRAHRTIRPHLPRTPLVRSEYLSTTYDANVYLKREDTLPTGAFKVRGGINLCAGLGPEFHDPGLIAASSGNHGLSVAYAGREFDIPVVIVVPEDPNRDKVAAIERLGATVIEEGADYDGAREWAEQQALTEGYRYVHSANEAELIAGVGTAGLEVAEDLSSVDLVVCPVGGGSSASGYCLTVGSMLEADVIGVQSEGAPAMHDAWHSGELAPHTSADTIAEGLQSRVPFELTTGILRRHLTDMVLVSDDRIAQAVRQMFAEEKLVLEGAGAAATAALDQLRDRVRDHTVVVQVSGRNVSGSKFDAIIG